MMGSGMAANLQKAGHELVVHDLRRAAAEPCVAAGAVWVDTPRAVAEAAEVVFTSLPGPPEVEAVALGENGLLSGMSRSKAYFDLSTNSHHGAQDPRRLCRARRRRRPAPDL